MRLDESAHYEVLINYDAAAGSAGGTFAVSFGAQMLTGTVQAGNNQMLPLGRVALAPGSGEIRVAAREIKGGEMFRLRRLELKPVQPTATVRVEKETWRVPRSR